MFFRDVSTLRKIKQIRALAILALISLTFAYVLGIDYKIPYEHNASGKASSLIFSPGGRAKLSARYNISKYIPDKLKITSEHAEFDLLLNATLYVVMVINTSGDTIHISLPGPVKVLEAENVLEVSYISLIKSTLGLAILVILVTYLAEYSISRQ